ncbi:putative methyltransferase-like protein 25 [Rhipicephalus microplus]|uniref:putative methyltransferase-like protein 25 n=1 Tax=Rhipicephalus microplus TaxID=6941 RepID=UPI003F6CAA1D
MSSSSRMNELRRALSRVADFTEANKSFINAHMVDFYTKQHWERLVDADVGRDLLSLTEEELLSLGTEQFMNLECVRAGRVPALQALALQLERHTLSALGALSSGDRLAHPAAYGESGINSFAGRGMSPKKEHEVDAMAELVASLAHRLGVRQLLDLGSGKGYLAARMCGPPHALRVLAVDSSEARNRSALERAAKMLQGEGVERLRTLTARVDDRFNVEAALGGNEEEQLLVCGLHTCGELGPSALRLAVRGVPRVRGLCMVGCCYHLLERGFPMSRELGARGCQDPGRNARMLAAQCADRRQETGNTLFWRALLQLMLTDEERDSGKRVGRLAVTGVFADYARKALRKLGRDVVDEFALRLQAQHLEHEYGGEQRRQLLAFHRLRIAWAGCIEALLLLDRLVFLLEQWPTVAEAHIVRLFDPTVSPRCHALVALMQHVGGE